MSLGNADIGTEIEIRAGSVEPAATSLASTLELVALLAGALYCFGPLAKNRPKDQMRIGSPGLAQIRSFDKSVLKLVNGGVPAALPRSKSPRKEILRKRAGAILVQEMSINRLTHIGLRKLRISRASNPEPVLALTSEVPGLAAAILDLVAYGGQKREINRQLIENLELENQLLRIRVIKESLEVMRAAGVPSSEMGSFIQQNPITAATIGGSVLLAADHYRRGRLVDCTA